MTYITTHHQFVIDEKHPADVFDEMSNFFSLYTVTLDSFHQLSIGLTVPENFDIDHNAKLNSHYQNFIKAVRYSIPDANVLPIKIADDEASLGKGMIELMIQYHEGRMITTQANASVGADESKPKLYQKILGVMLPNFDRTQEQDGLYPQRPESVVPVVAPIPPQPVPVPVISQPAPVVASQPSVPPQYQQPQYQPPQNPPIAQPQEMPTVSPVVAPMPQAIQQPTLQPINYLPKPSVSIKPYRELLTQAILEQAILEQTKQDKSTNSSNQSTPQTITEITLKSKDSLTTAMIETLFASFSAQSTAGQRAYDAIDLASYGLEELRPKLRQIGVAISDEAQFALNAKAKATAQDLEKIRQGIVNPADIHLATQLNYGSSTISSTQFNQATTQQTQVPAPQPTTKPLPQSHH